jgi:hypothetical protein
MALQIKSQKIEYQAARDVAAKELEELLTAQQKTEQRIVQLRQTIASLDALAGRRIIGETPGLTDAIRSIFKALPENTPIATDQIKARLLSIGFAEGQYSNFMSSIHVVLRRLEESNEILRREDEKSLRFVAIQKDFLEGL